LCTSSILMMLWPPVEPVAAAADCGIVAMIIAI
jgi:hypothetical protein